MTTGQYDRLCTPRGFKERQELNCSERESTNERRKLLPSHLGLHAWVVNLRHHGAVVCLSKGQHGLDPRRSFHVCRFCLLCAVLHRSVRVRLGLIYPAEITLPRRQFYLGLLMPSS